MQASKTLSADVAIGLTAGLVATGMTESIQNFLYRLTPERAKRREERVRPGSLTEVAAKKLASGVDAKLTKRQIETTATAIRYGSGMPWGLFYALLRRSSGMTPAGAALATGASMSLILDEALTPAMGFSAPNRNYPAATHVRGFIAHLAFGAMVTAIAEILYRLTGTGPDSEGTGA